MVEATKPGFTPVVAEEDAGAAAPDAGDAAAAAEAAEVAFTVGVELADETAEVAALVTLRLS